MDLDQDTDNGGRSCCSCCLSFIFTAGLTSLFLWLSLRPDKPKCSIEYFYVPALNKSLDSHSRLNTTLNFMVRFANPNRDLGIYYDDVHLSFSNTNSSVANYTVPRFYQGHKKKAKKDHKKDGGAATTCHGLDEPGCWPYGQVGGDCCADLYCEGHPTLNDTVCVECIDLGFFWSPLAPCCAGTVQGISNLVDVCCVASGQACSADSDCCGYNGSPGYTCQSGTCQQLQ